MAQEGFGGVIGETGKKYDFHMDDPASQTPPSTDAVLRCCCGEERSVLTDGQPPASAEESRRPARHRRARCLFHERLLSAEP